jgi:type IV pilus assembly protein PilO
MIQRLKGLLGQLKWVHVIVIMGLGAGFIYYNLDTSELDQKEQAIQTEQQSIAGLERKLQEAKEFERQLEEKKKKYKELVNALAALKESLPKQFFLPDLLSDILKEAKQLELEVTLIRPDQKEEQGELYNSLGFGLEVKGTFVQLFVFFDRVARLARLINVESFSIQKDGQRASVVLGGSEGAFAGSKLSGGRSPQVGVSATMRLITYRYRGGSSGSSSSSTPNAAQGGKN